MIYLHLKMQAQTKIKLIKILKLLPILFALGLFFIPSVLNDPKTPQQSISSVNQTIKELALSDKSAKTNESQIISVLEQRKNFLLKLYPPYFFRSLNVVNV